MKSKLIIALFSLLFTLPASAKALKGCACNGLENAATPTASPPAGPYSTTQTVLLSDTSTGATIYCTVDGTPATTSSAICASLTIAATTTVHTMATAPGFNQSPQGIYIYTITTQALAPVITPGTNTYPSGVTATMSCSTPGCVVHYTNVTGTTGVIPTCASASYGAPIGVSVSSVLKGISCAAGYSNSPVTTVKYTIAGVAGACPASSGPLTVNVQSPGPSQTRVNGVSPLNIFYDFTTSTDSSLAANQTVFNDVIFAVVFGDAGPSGTGSWAYGSNPGQNSTNVATGAISAHLYRVVETGGDQPFTATVTATDPSGNTVVCTAPTVTAYDPAGANGYPGAATTCVAIAAPVPGSNGCPASAAVLSTSSFATGISTAFKAGHRVLFHCGDTFTGNASPPPTVGASVGAYGGCQDTQTNRPIMRGGFIYDMHSGDVRVADLDFENTSSGNAVSYNTEPTAYDFIPYQMTLYNLKSSGNNASFYFPQEAQLGLYELVQTGMGTQQGTFVNYAGNNASQWGTNSLFNNLQYLAIVGGLYSGTGASNSGGDIETVRISQGQYQVIENNLIENANTGGAVLKVHAANSKNDDAAFTNMYNEYGMVTDNLFSGQSGAQLAEYTPQNPVTDERLRYHVNERNIFAGTAGKSHTGLAVSGVNMTVRDDMFLNNNQNGVQLASRGIEPVPQYGEIYNNSCTGGGTCAVLAAVDWASAGAAGSDSNVKNNLCTPAPCVSNSGVGNSVTNNGTGASPAFTNGSGTMLLTTDWKPTANYAGAISVPVQFDALGVSWVINGYDLGAVHH